MVHGLLARMTLAHLRRTTRHDRWSPVGNLIQCPFNFGVEPCQRHILRSFKNPAIGGSDTLGVEPAASAIQAVLEDGVRRLIKEGEMLEIAAAIVGATALVLVFLTALAFLKWGIAPSELTEVSRQRLVGCGYLLLILGLLGCIIAFSIMVCRLMRGI